MVEMQRNCLGPIHCPRKIADEMERKLQFAKQEWDSSLFVSVESARKKMTMSARHGLKEGLRAKCASPLTGPILEPSPPLKFTMQVTDVVDIQISMHNSALNTRLNLKGLAGNYMISA